MGTIKDVYDVIKDLRDFAVEQANTPFYDKVIVIQSAFFDMREEINELKEEKQKLTNEIEEGKKKNEAINDIILNNKGYFTKKSDNDNLIYCTKCYAVDNIIIPMTQTGSNSNSYLCSKCGSWANTKQIK